jgi:hypothetical protein
MEWDKISLENTWVFSERKKFSWIFPGARTPRVAQINRNARNKTTI